MSSIRIDLLDLRVTAAVDDRKMESAKHLVIQLAHLVHLVLEFAVPTNTWFQVRQSAHDCPNRMRRPPTSPDLMPGASMSGISG